MILSALIGSLAFFFTLVSRGDACLPLSHRYRSVASTRWSHSIPVSLWRKRNIEPQLQRWLVGVNLYSRREELAILLVHAYTMYVTSSLRIGRFERTDVTLAEAARSLGLQELYTATLTPSPAGHRLTFKTSMASFSALYIFEVVSEFWLYRSTIQA